MMKFYAAEENDKKKNFSRDKNRAYALEKDADFEEWGFIH